MTELKRPALFSDRDGTLIVEKHFISDPAEVELIPGVARSLQLVRDAGFLLFVVSNQSGVARGLLTLDEMQSVNRRLTEMLEDNGIELDGVFHCPHHPEFSGPCDCRKPARGMADQACDRFAIDLAKSYVIGDRISDISFAHNFGARGIMVKTGYGETESKQLPPEMATIPVVASFPDAVNLILREKHSGK
jgi:histidinol-phosphate phosphatase family protein